MVSKACSRYMQHSGSCICFCFRNLKYEEYEQIVGSQAPPRHKQHPHTYVLTTIHPHMDTHTHTHTQTHARTHTQTNTHTLTPSHTHAHTQTRTHTRTNTHTYLYNVGVVQARQDLQLFAHPSQSSTLFCVCCPKDAHVRQWDLL